MPPPIVLVGQEDDVTALAFAADGRLVTGSADGTFLVWDLKNADKPFLLPVLAHNREITFLGFCPMEGWSRVVRMK